MPLWTGEEGALGPHRGGVLCAGWRCRQLCSSVGRVGLGRPPQGRPACGAEPTVGRSLQDSGGWAWVQLESGGSGWGRRDQQSPGPGSGAGRRAGAASQGAPGVLGELRGREAPRWPALPHPAPPFSSRTAGPSISVRAPPPIAQSRCPLKIKSVRSSSRLPSPRELEPETDLPACTTSFTCLSLASPLAPAGGPSYGEETEAQEA